MAKITREKYLKINEGCANGFKLDLQYYVIWGEYKLEKLNLIENNKYDNFRLGFREHKDWVVNEYGCKYPKYDGTYDIVLNYNTSYKEDNCLITNGLGKDIVFLSGLTRKTIKSLQELTKTLTDEKLEELKGMMQ